MKMLITWLFAWVFVFSFWGASAYAIDFKITNREKSETSFGATKMSLTFSVQNAVDPEIGVGTRITYKDGTKGGAYYYCRPDGSGCRDTYSLYSFYTSSPRAGDKVVSKIEFYILTKSGEGKVVDTLTFGDVDPPDPGGGTDPGGTDPGGTDPGGTDPGGGDPGGGDPGGGVGCGCVDRIADMIVDLQDAVHEQGYDLSKVKRVADRIEGIVEDNGYKLDAVQDSIDSLESALVSRLDRANDTLDSMDGTLNQINDNLTPDSMPNLPTVDWEGLSRQNSPAILNSIPKVIDTNTYFSDPGQGAAVPPMPPQPAENFPVPIGKSFDRETLLNAQPSLSRDNPITSQPPLTPQPPMSPSNPMAPAPVPDRSPVLSTSPTGRDPVMDRSPVLDVDKYKAEPVRDRTNFFERK